MGNNSKLGTEGERLAAEYLSGKGYAILETNFRAGKSEIDIIARDGDILVFVEVKLRSRTDYGLPEEWVDDRKIEKVLEGAEEYLDIHDWPGDIRFDIVSIVQKSTPEIEHFEDAFS
jgi:putative endonuclease